MNELKMEEMNDSLVVDYLREHADLLVRFPDLMMELDVPHRCGKAVSLVEYQLSVIKDQNTDTTNRLKTLTQMKKIRPTQMLCVASATVKSR